MTTQIVEKPLTRGAFLSMTWGLFGAAALGGWLMGLVIEGEAWDQGVLFRAGGLAIGLLILVTLLARFFNEAVGGLVVPTALGVVAWGGGFLIAFGGGALAAGAGLIVLAAGLAVWTSMTAMPDEVSRGRCAAPVARYGNDSLMRPGADAVPMRLEAYPDHLEVTINDTTVAIGDIRDVAFEPEDATPGGRGIRVRVTYGENGDPETLEFVNAVVAGKAKQLETNRRIAETLQQLYVPDRSAGERPQGAGGGGAGAHTPSPLG
jgi:hypothetical protein